jgi:hypothetical protein
VMADVSHEPPVSTSVHFLITSIYKEWSARMILMCWSWEHAFRVLQWDALGPCRLNVMLHGDSHI